MNRLIGLFALSLFSVWTPAEPVRVAVASNFKSTLEEIAERYSDEHDVAISISSGSTGVLAAQILQGAPYHLFFSADEKTPLMLADKMQLNPPRSYAIGQLLFWCPAGAPRSVAELQNWTGTLAIADPKHAPYGAAAAEVINHLGWSLKQKKVSATNIAQVTHFVYSGAIQCGFIAASQRPDNLPNSQFFAIPPQWHAPIEQHVLALNLQQSNAQTFAEYVLTEGQDIIRAAGYRSEITPNE